MATAPQGVTVVVPTLNRGSYLIHCLEDLVAQTHQALEVLVVDQSEHADPGVLALADRNPNIVRHDRVSFRGLPKARNFGWQHARYDAILYVDDDIRCGPELVGRHLRALQRSGVGIAGGGLDEPNRPCDQEPHPGRFNAWTATPHRGFASHESREVDHIPGGNFSAWRQVLNEVDGFDESFGAGASLYEETDFCLRARLLGYRVWFDGEARLTHLAAPEGGCRVDQVEAYVRSLAHNRSMMIRRHVHRYRWPVAFSALLRLSAAYAVHYRKPEALLSALNACARGLKQGSAAPVCTRFERAAG
jgi:GT2 family glycosyltransferase